MSVLYWRAAQRGAALLDALIPALVIGLLFAVGAPALHANVLKTRVQSTAYQLVNSLSKARQSAIDRNALVTVKPANGAQSSWREGWVAFVDADRDGVQSGNEETLFVAEGAAQSVSIAVDGRFANRISFDGTGRLIGLGGAMLVCADSEAQRAADRLILISSTGRVRLEAEFDRSAIQARCPT